jgi:hypothetical protein
MLSLSLTTAAPRFKVPPRTMPGGGNPNGPSFTWGGSNGPSNQPSPGTSSGGDSTYTVVGIEGPSIDLGKPSNIVRDPALDSIAGNGPRMPQGGQKTLTGTGQALNVQW